MDFSDSVNLTGIVQQTRVMARVDANQWPTVRIANSCNNWLDTITGYAIRSDRRFQWDDTNHTALPEGTAQLTSAVSDYSWLTDEQENPILTLLGVSILQNGKYEPLKLADRNDQGYDPANFGQDSGTPTEYDKIADNIIRLDKKPTATVASGLKFYFQRVGSYFTASDTTKEPGVAPILHRGFVIASAYDCAITLGLPNIQPISIEMAKEEQKMKDYFLLRGNDDVRRMRPANHSTR